jgi:anti-sigma regulatory factor (Ser/Thr protein kinase)
MSNRGNISIEVYNDKFTMCLNSHKTVKKIAQYESILPLLKKYCEQESCDGFNLVVKSESRMKHLELILKIVEYLASNMDFLSEFEVNSMLLVINEALSNAVYHGNLSIPQNFRSKSTLLQFEQQVLEENPGDLKKKVKLTVNVNDELFEIKVEDNGDGFNFEQILNKTTPPSPDSVSGRGIYILKNSVDFIKFSNKGRTLVMKKEWRTL